LSRIAITLTLLVLARGASAQWGVWTADSLLAAGRIASAESAYYAAARARPTDATARAALGRYLAARGAAKVGAVLLEEARRFGGDSAALGEALVPMYARARDYRSLADLRPNVVPAPVRRRAAWLVDHPSLARFGDTVAIITYRPIGDGRGLGTVLLRIGRAELAAVIDPRVTGLHVPGDAPGQIRRFGAVDGKGIATASLRLGGVEFSNVPATLGDRGEPVRIGFDVLAPYMPTFDPIAGLLTIRRPSRSTPRPAGSVVPTLYDANGMRLLIGGRWHPTTSANAALLLASRRWTWDERRGDLVLAP